MAIGSEFREAIGSPWDSEPNGETSIAEKNETKTDDNAERDPLVGDVGEDLFADLETLFSLDLDEDSQDGEET